MIIFDSLADALEEAKWCAEQEKKVYIIRRKGDKFKVMPKTLARKYVFNIEVGFREDKK